MWPLAGFSVDAVVGNFVEPGSGLGIDIGQLGELPQGPEVLADIADATFFDLAFLPRSRDMAGARVEVVLAGKGEKARIDANDLTIALGYGGDQVVEKNLRCHASHEVEGMLVATQKDLETLTVRELQVETAAVTFEQAKGVELALIALVIERVEVAPVDLKALSGARLNPPISPLGPVSEAQASQFRRPK